MAESKVRESAKRKRLPRNRKMIDKQVTRETSGKEVRNRLRKKRKK